MTPEQRRETAAIWWRLRKELRSLPPLVIPAAIRDAAKKAGNPIRRAR